MAASNPLLKSQVSQQLTDSRKRNVRVGRSTKNTLEKFVVSRQSGMLPCFFAGSETLLPSNSENAWISFSRVSDGSMMSSM